MKNFLHKETPDLLETDIHIPTVPVYMFLQLLNHNPPHPNTYNKKELLQLVPPASFHLKHPH